MAYLDLNGLERFKTKNDAAYASAEEVRKQVSDLQYELHPEDDYNLKYIDARPDNFVDPNKLIIGYYINASGVQTAGSGWNCTDFINIEGVAALHAQNIGLGAYYDSTKTFISSITLGNSGPVVPPTTAAYLRVSILPENVESAIICPHSFYRNFAADSPVSHWVSPKKPYEEGYIPFTVLVNNTVAQSGETDPTTNTEGTPNYVAVDCVLRLPYTYKPVGQPSKLIMMCHGAGRGVSGNDNWTNNTNYNALVETFVSYGYAVFDCNGFKNDILGESFWGNARGVEAWRKAYKYVVDNYNVERTLAVYAFSMGGLTALNLAFSNFPNIDCIAMGSPVIDLEKVFESTDGTKAVLQVLYGLGDTWDDSKVIGCNPYKHIITTGDIKTCPYNLPPIKIWYGGNETGSGGNPALDKAIANNFVQAIVNSGGTAFYREVAGAAHDISYGASAIVNAEILTFIERYERVRPYYR